MSKLTADFTALFIVVFRNFFWIFISPYKAMRNIAKAKDTAQPAVIFALVYFYFVFANIIRNKTFHPFIISSSSLVSFSFFIITFFAVITFFYFIAAVFKNRDISYRALLFTFSYSLAPTIVWFFSTSALYLILPPPRTSSLSGASFSIFFIIFSTTMLIFRLILFYLSLRFSLKVGLYSILFFSVIFLMWFIPYSIMLYSIGVFRVPFI